VRAALARRARSLGADRPSFSGVDLVRTRSGRRPRARPRSKRASSAGLRAPAFSVSLRGCAQQAFDGARLFAMRSFRLWRWRQPSAVRSVRQSWLRGQLASPIGRRGSTSARDERTQVRCVKVAPCGGQEGGPSYSRRDAAPNLNPGKISLVSVLFDLGPNRSICFDGFASPWARHKHPLSATLAKIRSREAAMRRAHKSGVRINVRRLAYASARSVKTTCHSIQALENTPQDDPGVRRTRLQPLVLSFISPTTVIRTRVAQGTRLVR